MQKSDNSDLTLKQQEPTPMKSSHTPSMNTGTTHTTTTSMKSPQTGTIQANQSPQIPPQEKTAPLPPPNIGTSEKSERSKTAKIEKVEDPLALSPAHEKKAQQLAQTFAQLGVLIMGVNPIAGKIIFVEAETRARELLRVARHHKRMMLIIDRMIEGNDYMACALGHLGMLASIFALSGRLPDNNLTVTFKWQGMASLAKWDMLEGAMNGNNVPVENFQPA
jgi:hypothetical protein